MKHRVRVLESQELIITPAGHVSYDLQVVQYRCSCGWHTDVMEVSTANAALRDAARSLAHEHAVDGRAWIAAWTLVESREAERRVKANVPLSLVQAAYVLNLTVSKGPRRGDPDAGLVAELVHRGRLRVVDATQPRRRWTISPAELARYTAGKQLTPIPTAVAS